MFAHIKTSANEIAIYVPDDSAATSLPQLTKMLQHNCLFFRRSWREFEIVEPEMTIVLDNKLKFESSSDSPDVVAIPAADTDKLIDESFEIADSIAIAKFKEIYKVKEKEISELKEKIQKQELLIEVLQEELDGHKEANKID